MSIILPLNLVTSYKAFLIHRKQKYTYLKYKKNKNCYAKTYSHSDTWFLRQTFPSSIPIIVLSCSNIHQFSCYWNINTNSYHNQYVSQALTKRAIQDGMGLQPNQDTEYFIHPTNWKWRKGYIVYIRQPILWRNIYRMELTL